MLTAGAAYTEPNEEVTWTALGQDPDDACIVEDNQAQWTCAGPVATFSDYAPIYEKGTVETSDATPTVLDSYPLEDNATTHIEVFVTAYQTSGPSDGVTWVLRAAWRRTGPAVTHLGATSSDQQGSAAWFAALTPNGTNIEVRVTGEAGKTIRWRSIRTPHW